MNRNDPVNLYARGTCMASANFGFLCGVRGWGREGGRVSVRTLNLPPATKYPRIQFVVRCVYSARSASEISTCCAMRFATK